MGYTTNPRTSLPKRLFPRCAMTMWSDNGR
jgi:hypothetical protein